MGFNSGFKGLKSKVNNMLIEPDWLDMLMDRGENKVTLFNLSMTFQPHTWTPGIVAFLLTRMQT